MCEEECFLIGQFISQSNTGGHDTKELVNSNGKVGPYWSKNNWDGFVKNTLDMGRTGCTCEEDLRKIVATVSEAKINCGEIVDREKAKID